MVTKTECEYKGRLVSYMQDILEEWDEYSTSIRVAIEEDDKVRKWTSRDIEAQAASNADYESESDSDSSEYQDSDDEMTLDSTDDDSRCTRSIISILSGQEKRA